MYLTFPLMYLTFRCAEHQEFRTELRVLNMTLSEHEITTDLQACLTCDMLHIPLCTL